LELPGVEPETARRGVAAFLDAPEVIVERLTKHGLRSMDARGPVVALAVLEGKPESETDTPSGVSVVPCAILDLVVRQVTPSVRPDDVLSGLRMVAGLEPSVPPRATRLAQGLLTAHADLADPLAADRETAASGASSP
jgi:hypothetical protein